MALKKKWVYFPQNACTKMFIAAISIITESYGFSVLSFGVTMYLHFHPFTIPLTSQNTRARLTTTCSQSWIQFSVLSPRGQHLPTISTLCSRTYLRHQTSAECSPEVARSCGVHRNGGSVHTHSLAPLMMKHSTGLCQRPSALSGPMQPFMGNIV